MFKNKKLLTIGLLFSALGLSACTIKQNIRGVQDNKITHLCIKQDPNTHMEEYEPMLRRLIEAKNITTSTYLNERPDNCRYHLSYFAKWSWDGAMYLRQNTITVFDNQSQIGRAEYEAGIMSLAKWGRTESKVRPLVDQLFP